MPSGVIKITTSEGQHFITRVAFISEPTILAQYEQNKEIVFDEWSVSVLLSAVRKYNAECLAMKYLARAEHSRFQLMNKLEKKGFTYEECQCVFDYLESKGFLDDVRFAGAWLRTRSLHRKEGRLRLAAELAARGISYEIAAKALDAFFTDNSEENICKKAFEMQIKKGLRGNRLILSMQRLGFPLNSIYNFVGGL